MLSYQQINNKWNNRFVEHILLVLKNNRRLLIWLPYFVTFKNERLARHFKDMSDWAPRVSRLRHGWLLVKFSRCWLEFGHRLARLGPISSPRHEQRAKSSRNTERIPYEGERLPVARCHRLVNLEYFIFINIFSKILYSCYFFYYIIFRGM